MRMTAYPSIVLGCAGLGGLFEEVSDRDADQLLESAWHGGLRAFDVAPHYGAGLAEERLGRFLSRFARADFVVSTKVGRLLVDDPSAPRTSHGFVNGPRRRRVFDYSRRGVRRSIDDSLMRMGLDYVDVALVHDPEGNIDQALTEAVPELIALRDAGTIGAFGVGTNYVETALRFLREAKPDMILIAGRFTLLDRAAASELLPLVGASGTTVLVAGMLNSGVLANPVEGARFDYVPAADAVLHVAQRMERYCLSFSVPLRAAAFQFAARHPAVTARVIGPASAAAVKDCLDQLSVTIPQQVWRGLDAILDELCDSRADWKAGIT